MWFEGAINQALDKSKNEKVMLLCFIRGANEDSIKMNNILNVDGFKNEIKDTVVALRFEQNSDNAKMFGQIYPIKSVPIVYLISSNANVLDTLIGFVEKADLISRINAALDKQKQIRNEQNGSQKSEASGQVAKGTQASDQSSQSCSLKRANDSPSKTEKDAKDKEKHAQELLKELRVKKAKEEEQKALEMEKERIRTGKEIMTAKEIQRQKELEEIVKQRTREKMEERKHKERVLEQIKQDQEDRKARAGLIEVKAKPLVISQPTKIESNQTRIQFRLPDSSTIKNVFNIQDTLRTVFRYIEDNTSYRSFKLVTNFPVKEFGDADLDKTLVDLRLAPSACLIVKTQQVQAHYLDHH